MARFIALTSYNWVKRLSENYNTSNRVFRYDVISAAKSLFNTRVAGGVDRLRD